MPKIGTSSLLRKGSLTGNLDENDDFVAPGVGAMDTINWLYAHLGFSINWESGAKIIRAMRDDQVNFYDFKDSKILETVTEQGRFTTFGCEIICCQFSVFRRLKENKKMALLRSNAPISKEKLIENDCEIKSNTLF